MKHQLPCPRCRGLGHLPLPPHLAATLALIPARGSFTAHDLHEREPIGTPNAYLRRLEALRALRLVTRARDGKSWRYSRLAKASATA